MDHEALKSLLNIPHFSGKLARWGLAIQELDLEICYRPGCFILAAVPNKVTTIETLVMAKDGDETVNRLTTTKDDEFDAERWSGLTTH